MKEEIIGCNVVSMRKLELGDNLSVRFPSSSVGIQTYRVVLTDIDDGFWDYRLPGNG